jgi:uncharacterized protein (DUF488 family)
MTEKTIWTIGHSTRSADEFIDMLKAFSITHLVDVRTYPGSRRYPHFNKDTFRQSLTKENIRYTHLPALGGRRKPKPDSKNIAWKNEGFRGYADYMQTAEFNNGIKELEAIATAERTAYMCSEAVWWKCHRSLVSDYLKVKGWQVLHIMSLESADEHPYTKPAKVADGELKYY